MSSVFSSVVLNPAFRLAGDSNVGPEGMASPSSRLSSFILIILQHNNVSLAVPNYNFKIVLRIMLTISTVVILIMIIM